MPSGGFLELFRVQLLNALSPKRRELARIRGKWAKPGSKDGWLARRYFELTLGAFDDACVDERTWLDLEFPAIFSQIDTTETPLGSQVLFRKLREYVDDPNGTQCAVYQALRADALLRKEIQLRLSALQADSNAEIADLVFGQPPHKPEHHRLLQLWSAVSVATLLSVLLSSLPFVLWLPVVAVNLVVLYRLPMRYSEAETLRACFKLLRVAMGLAAITRAHSDSIPQLVRLRKEAPQRAPKRSFTLFSLFSLLRGRDLPMGLGELAESFYLWLNIAFLLELVAYCRRVDRFMELRSALASTFELVGSLDAAVAVASYLERFPEHSVAAISDRPLIEIEEGWHPLIPRPVKNSISLDGRSALVTGSNMAGKTTFIKMVGVNVIFGRTLGFCFASRATIPRATLMASIRSDHSVESGKSHYFAEVEAIHSFIDTAKRGRGLVFVIDELFNGTNTVERLAIARAVLESLSKSAQLLVTTHDVELQALVGERYDLYHFQEDPDVQGFFDYRLRAGATEARNAIRLLERMEFPSEVVARAMSYARMERVRAPASLGDTSKSIDRPARSPWER